eukprot:CAMPEP_0116998254 /NCGR_PEP_ID=MMETSP0472-20121206/1392_1 /TAXON_ID=693140 ORGANISM="Tiarina fusus, Strain LIS" /NCGR_SAMPLE_ID=MMETSP0472 /ASSEMBLY_ACC=CAM_ASM_000603 /LENGTH=287 /DNA_ID=CAMNT_0004697355 /DNA_START=78 /DNA_END=941 /DNA_ORIENTATION=-
MKYSTIILHVVACVTVSHAFSPSLSHNKLTTSQSRRVVIFSQWEDEDEEVAVQQTSFDQAGAELTDEDDKKRMDDMGDFDSNPAYQSADIDRVRAAIKERTAALGLEKSKVTSEMIQAAQERAKESIANGGAAGDILDLSQISDTAPRGQDEVPAMFYDPEAEMSEAEMVEADPVGQMSILDQVSKELSESTFPTPFAALKEVFLLIFIILFTAFVITQWDSFLRDVYTGFGFIPTQEEIMQGAENLALPEGWTNGMSEDDFMNFQDEVGSTVSSVTSGISSSLPEL